MKRNNITIGLLATAICASSAFALAGRGNLLDKNNINHSVIGDKLEYEYEA